MSTSLTGKHGKELRESDLPPNQSRADTPSEDDAIEAILSMGAETYRRLTDALDVEVEVLNYQTTY